MPCCVTVAAHRTQVIKPRRIHAGLYTQRETRKLWTRIKEGFQILDVGRNRSARRKPTKAGMESANQIHIQPLASCIGERKFFEH